MELSNTQIAKLVLGYLKQENCQSAVTDFINTSKYIKNDNPRRNKYIVTRVLGCSLTDILHQYAKIYTIVQERLEESDFFNSELYSSNLVSQLTYLLDNKHSSRSSSPGFHASYSSTPIKINHYNNRSTSPDTNTTPLKSLPGNSHSENTPHRQVQLPTTRSHRTNRPCTTEEEKESSDNEDHFENAIQVFTQTLLEHQELQERLANNINTVRHTEFASSSKDQQPNTTCTPDDIDSAIKAVLDKTESDPLFETLIGEIIGSVTEKDPKHKHDEEKRTNKEENTRKRASLNKVIENIESVNKEAVDSIITTSQEMSSQTNAPTNKLSVNTDIIMYDGNLDTFMKNSNGSTSAPMVHPSPIVSTPSSMVLNQSGGLLMMQPQVNNSGYIQNGMEPGQSFFLINVAPQPPQYVITEQDILTMPTVILRDDKKETKPKLDRKSRNCVKKIKTLKPRIENTTSTITEYLKVFNCDSTLDSTNEECVTAMQPEESKTFKLKKNIPTIHVEILPTKPIMTKPTETKPDVNSSVLANEEVPKPIHQVIKKEVNISKPETTNSIVTEAGAKQEVIGSIEPKVSGEKSASLLSIITPESRKKVKRNQVTPRSGNRSHVRALDFKFATPGKEEIFVKQTTPSVGSQKSPKASPDKKNPSKTVKTLFTSPAKSPNAYKKKKKSGSWDAELRALACGGPTVKTRPLSPRKKKRKIQNKANLNRTIEDAEKIEAAIGLDSSLEKSPDENKDTLNKGLEEKVTINKAKRRIKTKKSPPITRNTPEIIKPEESMEMDEECSDNKIIENKFESGEIKLINCDSQPRFKRKCNIDKNIKREVKVTKVKEIKKIPFNETTDKLILSPSKVHNASKRLIVDVEPFIIQTEPIPNESIPNESIPQESVLTPETIKIQEFIPPSAAKRNIIPILETPVKILPPNYQPNTPGFFSPVNTNDTPFTKVFKEHLQGIDIANIVTPQFPLTPNFPFTPFMDQLTSPKNNRGTDYSTSSSYYQPSDTEQNKSLELMIKEECVKRNEANKLTQIEVQSNIQIKPPIIEDVIATPALTQNVEDIHNAVIEKIKSLKSNVIGRKNLNLLKKGSSDESSSNSESSDSESGSDSGCSWPGTLQDQNDTIIKNYPLRSSQKVIEILNIKSIIAKSEFVPELTKPFILEEKRELTEQEKVLRELDEKKKRTIARMKGNIVPVVVPKKSIEAKKITQKASKLVETIPKIVKQTETIPKMVKQTETIPKNVKQTEIIPKIVKQTQLIPKIVKKAIKKPTKTPSRVPVRRNLRSLSKQRIKTPEKPAMLHISSDEDSLEPMQMVEVQLRSSKCNTPIPDEEIAHPLMNFEDVLKKIEHNQKTKHDAEELAKKQTSSDQEAEKLVKGLKQMGIHLVHNKSPKCPKINTQKKLLNKSQNLNILLHGEVQINVIEKPIKFVKEINVIEQEIIDRNEIIAACKSIEVADNQKIDKFNLAHDLEISLEDGEVLSEEEIVQPIKIIESKKKIINEKSATNRRSKEKVKDKPNYSNKSTENSSKLDSINDKNRSKDSKNKPTNKKHTCEDKRNNSYDKRNVSHRDDAKQKHRSKSNDRSSSKDSNASKHKTIRDNKSSKDRDLISKDIKNTNDNSKSEMNKLIISEKVEVINKSEITQTPIETKRDQINRLLKERTQIIEALDVSSATYKNQIHMKHDPKHKAHTVYDFELVNKTFSLDVFIDEIDMNVIQTLSTTSFDLVLDIPERINVLTPRKKLVQPIAKMVIPKKVKPLNIIYNASIEQNEVKKTQASPLDDLYKQESSNYHKSSNKTQSTSLTNINKRIIDKQNKINETKKEIHELELKKSLKKAIESTNEAKPSNNDRKSVVKPQSQTLLIDADKKVANTAQRQILVKDESLMNYAICGDDGQKKDAVVEKRKRDNSDSEESVSKRQKQENCQQLLKEVNVEDFLKRLHGDS